GNWISVGLWDRSIQLWRVGSLNSSSKDASGAKLATAYIGHTQLVSSQAFSADSTLMASTSAEGLVKLWDIAAMNARASGVSPAVPNDSIEASRYCLATLLANAGEAFTASFLPPP